MMKRLFSALFDVLRPKEALRPYAAEPRFGRAGATRPLPASFDRMMSDSMVLAALRIKRLGVLAAGWSLEPGDDSPAARRNADFARAALARMRGSAETILTAAMDAFARGLSVQELLFEADSDARWGSRIWLAETRAKDPALFTIDRDQFGGVSGLTYAAPGESAVALPRAKFVIWTNGGSFDQPRGVSDLEAVRPHFEAKARLLSAWRMHLERFASPTLLARFGAGASDEDRAAMLSTLDGLATATAIVAPEEFQVEPIAAPTEASRGFQEAIEFHDRQIARAILGQTLTTDEGRRVGSLAMGKVHLQVLLMQLSALRRELADTVMGEGVLRPLIELNFGAGSPVPRFVFEGTRQEAFVSGVI